MPPSVASAPGSTGNQRPCSPAARSSADRGAAALIARTLLTCFGTGSSTSGHRLSSPQEVAMTEDTYVVWITTRRIKAGTYDEFRHAWRPREFPAGMLRAYECFAKDRDEVVG